MTNPHFFLLVEGFSDQLFAERIITPILARRYKNVTVHKYAERKTSFVEGLIRSAVAMGGEYLVLTDFDAAPCITEKRRRLCARYRGLSPNRVAVAVRAIEGWYVAGLPATCAQELGLGGVRDCDFLTKEQLRQRVPLRSSELAFRVQMLERFQWDAAQERSRSLAYLRSRYLD